MWMIDLHKHLRHWVEVWRPLRTRIAIKTLHVGPARCSYKLPSQRLFVQFLRTNLGTPPISSLPSLRGKCMILNLSLTVYEYMTVEWIRSWIQFIVTYCIHYPCCTTVAILNQTLTSDVDYCLEAQCWWLLTIYTARLTERILSLYTMRLEV